MRNILILSVLLISISSGNVRDASAETFRACDQGSELEREKCHSRIYLDRMAAEKDATVAASGVVVRPVYRNERGTSPRETDGVTVGYHLTDREGKLIEATTTEDEVATFPLDRLIRCWQVAVPMMTTGSLYKITCPSDTAYGDKGAGEKIKGGAALTFRITLFAVGDPARLRRQRR